MAQEMTYERTRLLSLSKHDAWDFDGVTEKYSLHGTPSCGAGLIQEVRETVLSLGSRAASSRPPPSSLLPLPSSAMAWHAIPWHTIPYRGHERPRGVVTMAITESDAHTFRHGS